jgi:predicted nucleic acid-binding protein
MAKQKVYLETSVISYLTARPSRDVVKLAKQELTRQWWKLCSESFSLWVSRPVIEEISAGDVEAARLRREAVAGFPELVVTDKVNALYRQLLSANIVPEKAPLDALHIAIAAVHGMTYLLTWNCSHINNATNKPKAMKIIRKAGYAEVTLATPEELWR